MSDDLIYLDHHATTPIDPRVVDAMLPYFTENFGNPGSVHAFGEVARQAIDEARAAIATVLGADPAEIVFTSGATESNNLAIRGVTERSRRRGDHLVTVATEHPAVLEPVEQLAKRGSSTTILEVEQHPSPRAGWLDPSRVVEAITDQTCLVSVMLANNEIGTIQPIAQIAEVCHARGVMLHCDATQAVGRIPVDVAQLGADLLSFSAHKFYGPKGVGALYVRRASPRIRLASQITGGGQQQGRRSGTLNVPGIVGMATALRLARESLGEAMPRIAELRNRLADQLLGSIAGTMLVGPELTGEGEGETLGRLPDNLNIAFDGLDGESLMLAMPTLAVSSGAACSSAKEEPSHVLRAIGLTSDQARSSLRFGLGRSTTAGEIDRCVHLVSAAVRRLRQMSSA